MIRRFIPPLGVLLVLAVAAAPATGDSGPRSDLAETGTFEERSGTLEFELTAPEGTTKARLVVRTRVRSGRVGWTLIDPTGKTRLKGHGRRGRVEGDTGVLESIPGSWLLELSMEKATGSYRVTWRAH